MDGIFTQATTTIKASPVITGVSIAILILAFVSMVNSAYTADHIKRSKCFNTTDSRDENIHKAYSNAWKSSLFTGILTVGMGGVLIWIFLKKK
jgi:ABC-type uncharacterized transport system permease subunit